MTWYFSAEILTVPNPFPPRLCPGLIITRDEGHAKVECNIEDMYGYVFAYEFIGSFLLIFTWLVIRNYQIGQDFANRKLEAFAKCALIPLIYASAY